MICERENKIWGGYEVLHGDATNNCEKPSSITKVLTVMPGTATSLQLHLKRTEQWTVIEGELYIEVLPDPDEKCIDGVCKILKPGDHITVPKGSMHRFTNISDKVARFIEVQTGDCYEDDIIRFVPSYDWNKEEENAGR